MKALVIAAALVASTSIASAGAARDARPTDAVDKATATVIADAGRMGTTGLTSLNGNANPWTPSAREAGPDVDTMATQVEPGMLLVVLGIAAVALARPVVRVLRRHEQQRRATALASTLSHTHRG